MTDHPSPQKQNSMNYDDQNQTNGEELSQCIYKKIGNDLLIQIGSGSFGAVYKAINEVTSEIVAIKEIPIESSVHYQNKNLIQNEINTLQILNDTQNDEKNHNIIKYLDNYRNSESYCLVTEYCPGGNLLNYINVNGFLNESLAAKIFGQVCEAINYCNNVKFIAHRDLKLENILIVSIPNVKLADFGMSVPIISIESHEDENKRQMCTSFGGSIFYSAPEVICKIPYDPILADIWSLGVILYIIISGTLPWYIDNRNRSQGVNMNISGFNDSVNLLTSAQTKQVMKQIMAGIYQPLPDFVNQDCKKLIFSMLQVNPKKRPSIEEILESSWLQRARDLQPILPDESLDRTSLVDSLPQLNQNKKKIHQSLSSSLQNIKQSTFSKYSFKGKARSSTNPPTKKFPIPTKKMPSSTNLHFAKRSAFSSIKSHSNCINFVNK